MNAFNRSTNFTNQSFCDSLTPMHLGEIVKDASHGTGR